MIRIIRLADLLIISTAAIAPLHRGVTGQDPAETNGRIAPYATVAGTAWAGEIEWP
jgi:hypothetical protein